MNTDRWPLQDARQERREAIAWTRNETRAKRLQRYVQRAGDDDADRLPPTAIVRLPDAQAIAVSATIVVISIIAIIVESTVDRCRDSRARGSSRRDCAAAARAGRHW